MGLALIRRAIIGSVLERMDSLYTGNNRKVESDFVRYSSYDAHTSWIMDHYTTEPLNYHSIQLTGNIHPNADMGSTSSISTDVASGGG